jgi:hypothetical protein
MDPTFPPRGAARACVPLLLCVVFAVLAPAPPLHAQALEGRVVLGEAGVPGARVTLHHVTRAGGTPVDSVRTGENGRFRLPLPDPDTASFNILFATAEHLGVRYFGEVLHEQRPPPEYRIEVHDTVSVARAASPPRISRRDMLFLPDPSGGWEVNEIVQLANPGGTTLLPDGATGTIEIRLPDDVGAFEVGEGQVRPDDVIRMGSRLFVLAPLTPGTRDLMLRYRLPAEGEMELPIAVPTDTFHLFVRQPAPDLRVTGLAEGAPVEGEGERFRLFSAVDLEATTLTLAWSGPGVAPVSPATAAVAVTALVLLLAGAAAYRRRGETGPPDSDAGAPARGEEPAPREDALT